MTDDRNEKRQPIDTHAFRNVGPGFGYDDRDPVAYEDRPSVRHDPIAEPRTSFGGTRSRRACEVPSMHVAGGASLERATITRRTEAAQAAATAGTDPLARKLIEEIMFGAGMSFPDATHVATTEFRKTTVHAVQGYIAETSLAAQQRRVAATAAVMQELASLGTEASIAALVLDIVRRALDAVEV